MIYRAKAPLRISFSGGGTDIEPYVSDYGGCVISTTINKYVYATLIPRDDKRIIIHSKDLDVTEHFYFKVEGQLKIVKAIMMYMHVLKPIKEGFDLYIKSDVPVGTGLGLSSSLSVCLVKLFCDYLNYKDADVYDIADIAYIVEREKLNIKGGYQDQYATSFGGLNYITFEKKNVDVFRLHDYIPDSYLNELEYNLVLCYTGMTRKGENIIDKQIKSYSANVPYLHELKTITLKMKESLFDSNLDKFAKLFGQTWENKKKLTSGITNQHIDNLCEIGLKNGAVGVKGLGAGGGGYLLFYCPNDSDLLKYHLTKAGGSILDFNFDYKGVQSWSI